MKKIFLCSIVLAALFCSPLLAGTSKTVTFNGQSSDNVDLSYDTQETRSRDEVIDSTCTRQVPNGEHQVCVNETRYRQECHIEPARQNCYTTPSRQDCSYGPSRQECGYGPSRQDCSYGPGRQVCNTVGGGVVCHMENGRRICRTEPGRQQCHMVPGQYHCRTIPGQYYCRTVQGEYYCRTIPGDYRCDTIPAQNVCTQVPYLENVCHTETTYKTETYACKKTISVPYNVTIRHDAKVDLTFTNEMNIVKTDLSVIFSNDNDVSIKTGATDVLVFVKKTNSTVDQSNDTRTTNASFNVTLLPKDKVLSPVKGPADQVNLTRDQLTFVVGKIYNTAQFKVNFVLFAKSDIWHHSVNADKTLSGDDLQITDGLNGQSVITINLRTLGLDIPPRKNYEVTINTSINLGDDQAVNQGNLLLNQTKKVDKIKVK